MYKQTPSMFLSMFRPMLKSTLLLWTILIAATCFAGLLLLLADPATAVAESPPATGEKCQSITAATQKECQALVALYGATNGANWVDRTNWLSFTSDAPCHWSGVQCTGNRVTGLNLARNGLRGTIPISIGFLSELNTLQLDNNALQGNVPPTICALAKKPTSTTIAYNALSTRLSRTRTCLKRMDPNWAATQTVAPRNLAVTEFYTNSLRLSWEAIPYTGDGGYYEIYYGTDVDGPLTLHGTTADKATTTYLVNNLLPGQRYFFAVRAYTPPHGGQTNELRSTAARMIGVTKATTGNVVVAAYFPADNDLSSQIRYVATRMRLGTKVNPNVTVLLLVDGSEDGDTQLLYMKDGTITVTSAVQDEWGETELDTSDPATLIWFLQYVRSHYLSTKMVVSLMGHGVALVPEVKWPEAKPEVTVASIEAPARDNFPALPREWEATPSDETNNGYMSTTDVGEALMAATNDGANPFDIVFFDQCFQGNLDSLYEVHKTATVFVASPNYAWLVAAYDKYITGFSPDLSAEEMATHIINPYQSTLNQQHPNSIFWVRGNDVAAIGDAVSNLGDALTLALADGQQGRIGNAVRQSQYVDTTQCGKRNLQLGPPDELIGIESFAKNLLNQFAGTDTYGITAAIDQLRLAMQGVTKQVRSGNPYIAPDEYWDYEDTLTILAPLPRNSPSGVAWRASIYHDNAPFTATWTLDPTQPVTVATTLAYVKAGRWDDFLAGWYQGLTPTVGQWCHYIPPEQVVLDDAEALTLTVSLDEGNNAALNWTATDDESATEYWLYVDSPYAVSWELTQTVSLSQTSAVFAALAPGNYQMKITAHNGENEFVALSNAAAVTVPEIVLPPEATIFIPYVSR
ncbi:MAG: clostripain-related cysteine peptidase [Caldilineaceae bacterium]